MKKRLLIIILIIFIIMIITLSLIVFLMNNPDKAKENLKTNINTTDEKIMEEEKVSNEYNISIKDVKNKKIFYTVTSCIENYLNYINKQKYIIDNKVDLKFMYDNIYGFLSKEYIEKNKITESNFTNYIIDTNESLNFYPMEMKVLEGATVDKFLVYGIIENADYKYLKNAYIIVNLDMINNTFSIEHLKDNVSNISDIKMENNNYSIESNQLNEFEWKKVTSESQATEYIKKIKQLAIGNSDILYQHLNEEYRNKRFQNIDNFKKYIEENSERIKKIKLSKYKVKEYDDYIEYTCIDNYGNYYIFKETTVMDYTLILDSYTIDIPEVTEKYNKSSKIEKVGININRIITALNNKDYTYIYNKLDNTFKENNYKTQADFEKYIKTNLFNQNTIKFNEYQDRNGTYIYEVTIKNAENESQTKEMTIVMQLGEGTDYVMSFNIK